MQQFTTFGLRSGALRDVVQVIEAALGVKFLERDSSYFGAYFLAKKTNWGEIRVFENHDPVDHEPIRDPADIAIVIEITVPDAEAARAEAAVLGAIPEAVKIKTERIQ